VKSMPTRHCAPREESLSVHTMFEYHAWRCASLPHAMLVLGVFVATGAGCGSPDKIDIAASENAAGDVELRITAQRGAPSHYRTAAFGKTVDSDDIWAPARLVGARASLPPSGLVDVTIQSRGATVVRSVPLPKLQHRVELVDEPSARRVGLGAVEAPSVACALSFVGGTTTGSFPISQGAIDLRASGRSGDNLNINETAVVFASGGKPLVARIPLKAIASKLTIHIGSASEHNALRWQTAVSARWQAQDIETGDLSCEFGAFGGALYDAMRVGALLGALSPPSANAHGVAVIDPTAGPRLLVGAESLWGGKFAAFVVPTTYTSKVCEYGEHRENKIELRAHALRVFVFDLRTQSQVAMRDLPASGLGACDPFAAISKSTRAEEVFVQSYYPQSILVDNWLMEVVSKLGSGR
jgi:hypothetical protein